MATAIHCDGPDCNGWQPKSSDGFFITVREAKAKPLHFCDWTCLLRFSASIEPTEVIRIA